MSFQDDVNTLHNFLLQTPEASLKHMLIEGDLTEAHLRLLLKVVKNCSHDELAKCIENSSFPKIKFAPSESSIKESFWKICSEKFQSRGLLTLPKAA